MTDKKLEELLKIAEESQEDLTSEPIVLESKMDSKILKFVQVHNIKHGNIRVPTYRIYYEYAKWIRGWSTLYKVGKNEFFRHFNKMFLQTRTGRQRYYLLNDCLDMSPETMERAKRHGKKWQNTTKTKESKKRGKLKKHEEAKES
jgi:hypothetical protein